MEAIEALQFILLLILSFAGILLAAFLTLGIFLVFEIRKYLKRAAEGVERAANNIDSHVVRSIGSLLKYPLIGFIIKKLFRRFL